MHFSILLRVLTRLHRCHPGISFQKTQEIPRKRFTKIAGFNREIVAIPDELDRDGYCVLLDIGHAKFVNEEPEDAIRILGKDRTVCFVGCLLKRKEEK